MEWSSAALGSPGYGVSSGFFCLSFLLIFGALPYWNSLRQNSGAQAALRGANAAVVGILLGALYNPVWTVAVDSPKALAIALAAFGLLQNLALAALAACGALRSGRLRLSEALA